jgi:hypothetical protein
VLHFDLSLRSPTPTGDVETQRALQDYYERVLGEIKKAAYRGRQVDYKKRIRPVWQIEEEREESLRQPLRISQVAVIISKEATRPGYIFYVADNPNIERRLQNTSWHIKRRSQLPLTSTMTGEWIDKWELLREVEVGS